MSRNKFDGNFSVSIRFTSATDRRTDRQTDGDAQHRTMAILYSRAICTASRGKINFFTSHSRR